MFLNYLGHIDAIMARASLTCHNHREVMEDDRTYLSKLKVFASQLKTCFKQENSLFSYAPLELRMMFHPKPKRPKYNAKAIQHIQNCDAHCLSVMVNLASQPICTLHESWFNFSFCELSGLHENIDHDENC